MKRIVVTFATALALLLGAFAAPASALDNRDDHCPDRYQPEDGASYFVRIYDITVEDQQESGRQFDGDATGGDELFVTVNGERVFQRQKMYTGDYAQPLVSRQMSASSVTMVLGEDDPSPDPDDTLGVATAYRTEAGKGLITRVFAPSGARYTLRYDVFK